MAEPRRLPFQTLEPTPNGDITPEENTTIRFTLSLSETREKKTVEFSFEELLKNALGDSSTDSEDDPFGDNQGDTKLTDLARHFEEKYGGGGGGGDGGPVKKKRGRPRYEPQDDAIADGYDETDPFVDNSEAYDEVIPVCMTTKLGGFYINMGQLDFKQLSSDSSDDFSSGGKGSGGSGKSAKKNRKVKRITSSSEEDDGKPQVIKKKKFKDLDIKRKKRLSSGVLEGEKPFKRPKKPKDQDKINKPTAADPSKPDIPPIPGQPSSNGPISTSAPENSSPGEVTQKSVISLDGDSNSQDDKFEKPPVTEENAPQLPDGISESLKDKIEQIKQAAKESTFGRKNFLKDVNVRQLLLSIENESRTIGNPKRHRIYDHLSAFLPVGKATLLMRAKKLRLEEHDDKLKLPLEALKKAVSESMPAQLELFKAEWLAYEANNKGAADPAPSESGKEKKDEVSTESDDEEKEKSGAAATGEAEKKKQNGPKKRFAWNSHLRKLLCEVVMIKMKVMNELNKTSSPKVYLKSFLEAELRGIWQKGWMTTGILFRESKSAHGFWTNPKAKKPLPLTTQAAKPSVLTVSKPTAATSNGSIVTLSNTTTDHSIPVPMKSLLDYADRATIKPNEIHSYSKPVEKSVSKLSLTVKTLSGAAVKVVPSGAAVKPTVGGMTVKSAPSIAKPLMSTKHAGGVSLSSNVSNQPTMTNHNQHQPSSRPPTSYLADPAALKQGAISQNMNSQEFAMEFLKAINSKANRIKSSVSQDPVTVKSGAPAKTKLVTMLESKEKVPAKPVVVNPMHHNNDFLSQFAKEKIPPKSSVVNPVPTSNDFLSQFAKFASANVPISYGQPTSTSGAPTQRPVSNVNSKSAEKDGVLVKSFSADEVNMLIMGMIPPTSHSQLPSMHHATSTMPSAHVMSTQPHTSHIASAHMSMSGHNVGKAVQSKPQPKSVPTSSHSQPKGPQPKQNPAVKQANQPQQRQSPFTLLTKQLEMQEKQKHRHKSDDFQKQPVSSQQSRQSLPASYTQQPQKPTVTASQVVKQNVTAKLATLLKGREAAPSDPLEVYRQSLIEKYSPDRSKASLPAASSASKYSSSPKGSPIFGAMDYSNAGLPKSKDLKLSVTNILAPVTPPLNTHSPIIISPSPEREPRLTLHRPDPHKQDKHSGGMFSSHPQKHSSVPSSPDVLQLPQPPPVAHGTKSPSISPWSLANYKNLPSSAAISKSLGNAFAASAPPYNPLPGVGSGYGGLGHMSGGSMLDVNPSMFNAAMESMRATQQQLSGQGPLLSRQHSTGSSPPTPNRDVRQHPGFS